MIMGLNEYQSLEKKAKEVMLIIIQINKYKKVGDDKKVGELQKELNKYPQKVLLLASKALTDNKLFTRLRNILKRHKEMLVKYDKWVAEEDFKERQKKKKLEEDFEEWVLFLILFFGFKDNYFDDISNTIAPSNDGKKKLKI